MAKRRRRSKAKLFGFPLTKRGSFWVFIIGVLMVIGSSIQLLWLVYSFTTVGTVMAAWGVGTYYAGSYMMYMIPWLVIIVVMLTLGFYFISVGKKGR
ncbi:hypothetical protein LCGC14_2773970 [marine sediment metagenome]|uniref:Uncharacterized protein n=1 Tax=marine sediment metagenome TaxID=412755 RepID=A0A0F8ZH95_9ZZZZ